MVSIIKADELVYRLSFLLMAMTLIVFGSTAQVVKGTVNNKANGAPIPFATINSLDGLKGTFARIDGTFETTFDSISDNQKIVVSALGFKKDTFSIKEAMDVFLEESPVILDEITVVSKKNLKFNSYKIGYPNDRNGVWTHTVAEPFYQDGIKVKHRLRDGFTYLLQGVELRLDWELSKRTLEDSPIRLRIYENNNGNPGNDILIETQHFYPTKSKSKIIFETPIQLPSNGCFVSIEWLSGYKTQEIHDRKKALLSYYGHAIKLHKVRIGEKFDLNSEISWWQYDPKKREWRQNPNHYEKDGSDYAKSTFIPCIRLLVKEVNAN